MISLIQPNSNSVSTTEEVLFQFQDLEITRNTLVIRFLEVETLIPLKEIGSYDMSWYLHGPTSAKKYWFLLLTVELRDRREESGPIAVAEFSYADDEHELREDIEGNIAEAIDLALSWHGGLPEKLNRFQRDTADLASMARLS